MFAEVHLKADDYSKQNHRFFHIQVTQSLFQDWVIWVSYGRIGGRKRQMTPSKIESAKKLLSNGIPPKEVAHNFGVSIPTLYRWVPKISAHAL